MGIPQARPLSFSEIPVIDVGKLGDRGQPASLVDDIDRACRDVGFFYIVGHSFDQQLISRLLRIARQFFRQPESEKMKLGLDASMRGYLPLYYHSRISDDFSGVSHQEGFWMGAEHPGESRHPLEQPNRWPSNLPELEIAMTRYLAAIETLASRLGRVFGLALGQSGDFYPRFFDRPNSRLKLNHYPPQHHPERIDNIGVVPHTDSGAFTLLWQDENGGLEVGSKSGEWVGAPPLEGSFVVNIGDLMQYWSNGRFCSTAHRVINRNGVDRYSIPYFVNPGARVSVAALDGSDRFEAFDYGEYQLARWKSFFPVED